MLRQSVEQVLLDFAEMKKVSNATDGSAALLTLAIALQDMGAKDAPTYRELHVPGLEDVSLAVGRIADMIEIHGGKA